MSKKYLDSKGLSYLWQKIKSEISLNPGLQGEQGSRIYNAPTYSDYIVDGYDEGMRVNDLILDNGESVYSRRGNVYRIIDINDDTTGEFETNEIYVETQFNDIPENKNFIIVSKVENKDKTGYTYWALSNARSSSSDCAAIQLSNDDIHEKEGVIYLDKILSNSVDLNSLYFKLQRNPVYNGVTYNGKSRIIAINDNYDEENVKNWDCLYFSSTSSTNTTRLNTISGTRNAVFEIDNNTGYPHPYLLGTKYSSSDPNVVDGVTKYLGVFDEENAPESVSKFRCYKNINSSLDEQQLIFLVEDNVSIYNPTNPKVVIDEEPVTNLLGYKGDPGKDGDVPYIGSNGNWFIAGSDTEIKAKGDDGAEGPQGPEGEHGLTLISTITSLDELHNIATTDELHINDAYILDPNYDYTTHTQEYRKGALWVFRGEKLEDKENKIIEETSAGIFEYVCNLQGQKGEAGVDGSTGPQGEKGTGSLSYIAATCYGQVDGYVIAKYYNENMCIGDLVIDNGEVDMGRRGNMYRIINIIENPDLSKYNAQYPPSNPAIIIDKNIVCNLKGDTINGKYIFNSILNSYSFGYQREIIENIKVRRLRPNEKYLLSEIYGVDWEYINLDNKIQEGAKGKLYSDEVNYIDEISDIKYVDLSIGGTLFNCESEIIPENNYTIYDFTYKYLSGVEGTNAFAEGDATLAEGNSAHTEGEWNTAYGDYSHAEGESTTAQGQASHAEGEDTLAIGDVSHAEGSRTLAVGDYSHTEGFDTVAKNAYEHAQGIYNVSNKETDTFGDKNTIFSIGIGKSGLNRRNAIEVLQNGDVYINGIGDYDGTNVLRVSDVTGKIAKPLQKSSPYKHVVIDDIQDWFLHAVELTKYGLSKDDVDAFLDDKLTIEFHVETLLVGLKMMMGSQFGTEEDKNNIFYKILSKLSGRTSFSTGNDCEIKPIPKGKDLLEVITALNNMMLYMGLPQSGTPDYNTALEAFADDNTNLNINFAGLNVGAFDIITTSANWLLSQIFLPFFDFEQPRAIFTNKVKMNSLFGLKAEIASMVSDNKFAVLSYIDEEYLLSFNSMKGMGVAIYSGYGSTGSTGAAYSFLIDMGAMFAQVLSSIRRQIVFNLLKDIVPEDQEFNTWTEVIQYILYKYAEMYPEQYEKLIIDNGFVLEDGTPDYEEYERTLSYVCMFLNTPPAQYHPVLGSADLDAGSLEMLFALVKFYETQIQASEAYGTDYQIGSKGLQKMYDDGLIDSTQISDFSMFALSAGYFEGLDTIFNVSNIGDYNMCLFHDIFGVMCNVFNRKHDYHLVDLENNTNTNNAFVEPFIEMFSSMS